MSAGYEIVCDPGTTSPAYRPRGACSDLLYCRDREVILAGPSETGKTLAACWKLHLICSKYPGAQVAVCRKTYKSIAGSVDQTLSRVVAGAPVERFGGERIERLRYGNASAVWFFGLDDADKFLSTERDCIYVNQAEELSLDDWEKLLTRCTGRNAVVRCPQLFGDCNPGPARHWIRERAKEGKLRLLNSTHRDNPTLYTDAGELTEQGKRTMTALESLSGVRRLRLLLGQWATAAGAVFDNFDANVHVVDRPATDFQTWHLALDEGYVNPSTILLVGVDGDGRWHVAREFYKAGVLQSDVVNVARKWSVEFRCSRVAVDSAAAGLVADLQNAGVRAEASKGRVNDGIHGIQNRLSVAGDGRPRLTVAPVCTNTINEFESYEWQPGKDAPQKTNDHSMDALRYLHALLNEPTGAWTKSHLDAVKLGPPAVNLRRTPRFIPRHHFTPRRF